MLCVFKEFGGGIGGDGVFMVKIVVIVWIYFWVVFN